MVWISLMKFSNIDLISGALLGPVSAADTREKRGADEILKWGLFGT